MKLRILLMFLLLPVLLTSAYGQDENIQVIFDKLEYRAYDIVSINGNITEIIDDDNDIIFVVADSNNNLKAIDKKLINLDNTFTWKLELNYDLWMPGIYTLKINYGDNFIESTFEIIPSDPPLTIDFEFDQPEYNLGDIINFKGTIEHFDENKPLDIIIDLYFEDGTPMNLSYTSDFDVEGSFSGTIPNPSITHDNQDIKVIAIITVQGVEYTTSFYSYYMPDNSNEILYEMATAHDESLEEYYTMITDNTDSITSYSTMLESHDSMLLSHDSMLYHQDDMLVSYNQTQVDQSQLILNLNELLAQQSLTIQQNQIDIAITTGFLTNLNVTLSVDVPPVLTDEALQEIIYENQRQRDEIAQLNISIAENHAELEEAILEDEIEKVEKFKRNIASDEVSRAHAQARINMSDLLLLVYPQ